MSKKGRPRKRKTLHLSKPLLERRRAVKGFFTEGDDYLKGKRGTVWAWRPQPR